jgi:predicted nucleic acid-binding Zn finger protein
MIATATLARVDETRFNRATEALRKGEYSVTLSHVDSAVVTAFVRNSRGKSYVVSLTPNGGYCSCPDFSFRAVCCKHQSFLAVKLALDGTVIPEAPAPNLTLKRTRPGWGFAA